MKILVITDQFQRGGADRVASVMCNELFSRGHDLHIIADTITSKVSYPLDERIPIHQIVATPKSNSKKDILAKWVNIIKSIRKYSATLKPDAIITIASRMYLCTLIATRKKYPLFVADHTSFGRKQHPLIDLIRYHLYAYADGISILTKKDEALLGEKYPQKRVIYNPLSFPCLTERTVRKNNILCAGRLEVWKIKGFDIIISIWAKIANKYPKWTLEIAGDGTSDAQRYIQELVRKSGLTGRVHLLGYVSDMKMLYSETSIFALPSRVEGFPMVLMEAMSQGCACVAFSIGGASDEMMENDSGFLIPDDDIEAFSQALETLITYKEKRDSLSENAIRSISKFSVKTFGDEWERFLTDRIKK